MPMKKLKIKWNVQPASTGRFRSFYPRGWPSAVYAGEMTCAMIRCEDSYIPRNAKEGKHGPLTLCIADHSQQNEHGLGFKWMRCKETFATLDEAKAALPKFLEQFPKYIPKHLQTQEQIDKVFLAKCREAGL